MTPVHVTIDPALLGGDCDDLVCQGIADRIRLEFPKLQRLQCHYLFGIITFDLPQAAVERLRQWVAAERLGTAAVTRKDLRGA